MKQSISSVWLIGLIVTFITIFSGYLAITISYSRAFKIKDEVLNIIEKHKGMTYSLSKPADVTSKIAKDGSMVTPNPGAFQTISLYLAGQSYDNLGSCPIAEDGEPKWYGVTKLGIGKADPNATELYNSHNRYEEVVSGAKKYYYCFQRLSYNRDVTKPAIVYKIRLFYVLDIPIFGKPFSFPVDGTSDQIYGYSEDKLLV